MTSTSTLANTITVTVTVVFLFLSVPLSLSLSISLNVLQHQFHCRIGKLSCLTDRNCRIDTLKVQSQMSIKRATCDMVVWATRKKLAIHVVELLPTQLSELFLEIFIANVTQEDGPKASSI
mmetsp:Transcript_2811/g.4299  ORF Transcript_2811/g.4299 Transcript_2811/m.4299 type:complete len:121 (+) Transcript_2811:96-458(+)